MGVLLQKSAGCLQFAYQGIQKNGRPLNGWRGLRLCRNFLGVSTARRWLIAKAALLGAKLGAIGGPIAAWVVCAIFIVTVGWFSWIILDALIQGKGISITWKYTY